MRTRNVIIASFHSRSAAAAARSISGQRPISALSWAWAGNGRAIELEADLGLPPRLTPLDRRFGDTLAVFRACCGRSRIQAGVASGIGAWRVSTRVAPLAPLAFTGPRARAPRAYWAASCAACVLGRLVRRVRIGPPRAPRAYWHDHPHALHRERGPPPAYWAANAAQCRELSSADDRAAVLDWRLDDTGHRDATPGPRHGSPTRAPTCFLCGADRGTEALRQSHLRHAFGPNALIDGSCFAATPPLR
jgi:hypothetical protein